MAYLKCTEMPIAVNKLDYQTPYRVKICGEWHVQCNCIVLITVQSAENQVGGELEVKSGYVDLFGGLPVARAKMTLWPLLPDAGRGNWRRDTRWTTSTITAMMTTEAEVTKAGDTLAAAVVEGSAREVSRVTKST